MPDQNTGKVIFDCRNAYGESIEGDVVLKFRNLKVQTLNFFHKTRFAGEPLSLGGVPAFPTGLWQVDIDIKRYRFKSVFIDVPSNGEARVNETFFVKPAEAQPKFPSADDIRTQSRWRLLAEKLGTTRYEDLEDQQKAGLLNLFAKMTDPSSQHVFDEVLDIFKVKPARIYARVKRELWERVQLLPQHFHEQADGGSLHSFIDDWVRLTEHASFKTPDPMGNLQLTFASNPQEQFAVDADLDDHTGLRHAFDVIKHKFSGDTNPYDIHEVLVKLQDIDPGYRLL